MNDFRILDGQRYLKANNFTERYMWWSWKCYICWVCKWPNAQLLSSETCHQVGTEVRFTMGTLVPKARHNRDTQEDLCSGDPGLKTEDFGSRTTQMYLYIAEFCPPDKIGFGTCDYDCLRKYGFCRCTQYKMRLYRITVNPKWTDYNLCWKNTFQIHTKGRRPCDRNYRPIRMM